MEAAAKVAVEIAAAVAVVVTTVTPPDGITAAVRHRANRQVAITGRR